MINDTTVTTGSLEVPGARLHYEVRGDGPLVVLVGAPMDATAFAPVADLLAADHTVLTTDPRGHQPQPRRRPRPGLDPGAARRRPLPAPAHLDAGPAAVFGSSGGAVSALALAQAHPEQVHTVIAHEPPLLELLDDREQLHAGTEDMIATYLAGDTIGAWAQFMAQANITLPRGALEEMFGGERDPQQVADERFWFAHELRPTTRWQPDLAALRTGADPRRGRHRRGVDGPALRPHVTALAAALGIEPTMFPGDHIGFVDDPDTFAARLRDVLGQVG